MNQSPSHNNLISLGAKSSNRFQPYQKQNEIKNMVKKETLTPKKELNEVIIKEENINKELNQINFTSTFSQNTSKVVPTAEPDFKEKVQIPRSSCAQNQVESAQLAVTTRMQSQGESRNNQNTVGSHIIHQQQQVNAFQNNNRPQQPPMQVYLMNDNYLIQSSRNLSFTTSYRIIAFIGGNQPVSVFSG